MSANCVVADIRIEIAEMLRDSNLDGQVSIFAHEVGDKPLPHVVIVPFPGENYIEYHGTFGPNRNMTINLIARVVYPMGGSIESGDIALDRFLSSGTLEDASVVDALAFTGALPSGAAFTVYAASVGNHLYGEFGENRIATVSAEIPLLVQIRRS